MSISIIIAGLFTGLLLGVFGSGGSIITMPALLYLLDVEPKSAIAMSLGIVAVTATITALQHWHRGNVDLKITVVFGLFGVTGTYFGALLGVITPVVIQLGVFALVMYAAAWKMLKPARIQPVKHRSAGAMATDFSPEAARRSTSRSEIRSARREENDRAQFASCRVPAMVSRVSSAAISMPSNPTLSTDRGRSLIAATTASADQSLGGR